MVTPYLLKLRILPRWIIVLLDVFMVAFATYFAYLLRFNFEFSALNPYNHSLGIAINTFTCLLAMLYTRSYRGIVRYTGLQDGVRVFYSLMLSHGATSFLNLLYFYKLGSNLIPFSVILIAFPASFLLLFQYRLLIKNIFSYYRGSANNKSRILIYGAGPLGMVAKQVIDGNDESGYKVMGFVEDDIRKIGKLIHGTRIHKGSALKDLLESLNIDELFIAADIPLDRKNEIVDLCLEYDVKVRTVPPADHWVKGELSLKQIKEVHIEDLLGRESIRLDNEEVMRQLTGRCVCITGAAGSIGSELVRQVAQYRPGKLILIDQAESPLYDIEREFEGISFIRYFIADVTNQQRINEIFTDYKPEVIFHAAAYKHVPMMERNPAEAVLCNIMGTKNLADLAVKHQVGKFVMVSTDKAVNPTNVMGCSKRIAEIYVRALNNHLKATGRENFTSFITTRFGNVLGSNGSVIPFFQKQINQGGPITVTHPEITRYFMTIPEACQLVLEAGTMGNGGEIFIFDMGKSIKIVDLAKKMIRLSGLELNRDIEIVYTGLRPGEKLYEELLASKENTIPTHHHKIMIARVAEYDYQKINNSVESLRTAAMESKDDFEIVRMMKKIVPEFKSNSSRYSVLDNSPFIEVKRNG